MSNESILSIKYFVAKESCIIKEGEAHLVRLYHGQTEVGYLTHNLKGTRIEMEVVIIQVKLDL